MKEATTAYPLQWPIGWKRTSRPQKSKFTVNSFSKLREQLKKSLELMNASNVVISTNIPLNSKGDASGSYSQPSDKGAAVYFTYKKKQMVFACDAWDKVEDNVRAVHSTIDAIRGIDRWGASDMLERAFSGFAQLEAPIVAGMDQHWTEVLGCSDNDSLEVIKKKYRELVKKYHEAGSDPDPQMISKINHAYDQSKK